MRTVTRHHTIQISNINPFLPPPSKINVGPTKVEIIKEKVRIPESDWRLRKASSLNAKSVDVAPMPRGVQRPRAIYQITWRPSLGPLRHERLAAITAAKLWEHLGLRATYGVSQNGFGSVTCYFSMAREPYDMYECLFSETSTGPELNK